MQADVKQAQKNKQTKKIPVRNIKDLGIKKKDRTAAIESISIILLHPLHTCFN